VFEVTGRYLAFGVRWFLHEMMNGNSLDALHGKRKEVINWNNSEKINPLGISECHTQYVNKKKTVFFYNVLKFSYASLFSFLRIIKE